MMGRVSAGVERIPGVVRSLLWDTDPEAFDPARHPDYLMGRVLELGRPEACRWLRDSFGDDRVREFVRTLGPRRLSPRALNYWALALGLDDRPCLLTSCLANRSPLWRR